MKKNNLLKTVLLLVFAILFLQGCRNESLLENKQQSITNKKVIKILNAEELEKDKSLISEVSLLKKKVFKQHKSTSRTDNSTLDNAIIETEKVLLVEDGEQKTYTFPISRTYPNSMIENLVLRKNNDSTFSGILLQYNLTAQEKESIKQGKEVDLKSKIKIYEIDKIKIKVNSRLQTDVVGCYEITWETGYCKSLEHESGNDSECVVGGAPSPSIISVVDLCAGTDTQQDTSYSSGGDIPLGGSPSSGGGSGNTSTSNPDLTFNTFLFSSFDDQLQMCPTGDAQCIDNWQFNLSLQQYLQSLNFRVSGLSSYTPTLLTISMYFQEQGWGDMEKSFMTDKLTFFSNWFNSTSTQNISSSQKNEFINWGLNFFKQNPNTTKEQFQKWFLDGYSTQYQSNLTKLSPSQLLDFVNINKEIDASPYQEEFVKETNEMFVAFGDIDNLTEAKMIAILTLINPQYVKAMENSRLIVATYNFNRKFYPEWSKARCFWEASRESIQYMLDLGGLIPVAGEICDLTNGVIYTINGDGLNATLSYASAIPIAGWFSTGAKFGVKVVNKTASHIASRQVLKWILGTDGIIKFGYRSQLRKVLQLTDAAKQAHHIIPWEFANNAIVQKAAKSAEAFHMNDILNGIPLPTTGHLTGHNLYNDKLNQILTNLNNSNPNMSANQAYNHILALTNQIKTHIKNNPTYNLGQIASLIKYP